MGARKTIGVFIEGDDIYQEGIILNGLFDQAEEEDYNVLVFHSLMKKAPYAQELLPDSVVVGESAIYQLPDYGMFDGVVIMGELLRPDVTAEVIRRAREKNVPIINVNDEHEGCYNVKYDDVVGMKEMVLHLIRDHGCRDMFFMSGFEGNRESEEREAAYREALEIEGIPFDKEKVGYGQFYIRSVTVVEEYLKDHELPDAFVCANDTMAIFTVKYLTDHGYRVPEDVIVTGFDYIRDAAEYQPSITSVARSFYQSGRLAVNLLDRLWAGEEIDRLTYVPAHLEYNQSCGCAEPTQMDFNQINQAKTNEITKRDKFVHHISELWRDVSSTDTMENLMRIIAGHVDFFEWDVVHFLFCDDIFGQGNDEIRRKYGYSPNMTYVKYQRGKDLEFEQVFYPNILPDFDLQGDERVQVEFIPMYLKMRTVGYFWVSLEQSMPYESMIYAFLTVTNSAIIDLCLFREKDALLDKLDGMYVRDELTKLYNRFGMQRYAEKVMEVAKRDGKHLMCIAIDLDGLKTINDTHGHAAGDNAIVQVANAMRQACERREICIRSGGDEFMVIGIAEKVGDAKSFIQRVEEYLSEYNMRNQWPYQVACSCGYCVQKPERVTSLEEMVSKADAMMYAVKTQKKTMRMQ